MALLCKKCGSFWPIPLMMIGGMILLGYWANLLQILAVVTTVSIVFVLNVVLCRVFHQERGKRKNDDRLIREQQERKIQELEERLRKLEADDTMSLEEEERIVS